MHLPTVRVKSPTGGFITINASDLAEHHEFYEASAPGFVDPRIKTAAESDDGVRAAAADLVERTFAAERDMTLDDYRDLPAAERLGHIVEVRAKFDAAMDSKAADRARQHDDAEREAADAVARFAVELRVAKGPAGRFYVMRGVERLGSGHATEADATAAMATFFQA